MKYFKYIILTTIVLLNSHSSFSQTADFGFGALRYSQKGNLISSFDPLNGFAIQNSLTEIDETVAIPSLIFSYYYPFYKPLKNISIGGLSGFSFYTHYEKKKDPTNLSGQTIGTGRSSGFFIGYQIPLYASIRFFNGATKDLDEGFGGGLGFGYVAHGFTIENESGFMYSPSFLAEIRYKAVSLKFEKLINKFTTIYSSDTGDIPRLKTSFIQIHLSLRIS